MLSVNGVDLSGLTNQEVVNVLQQAPNNVTLVMSWGTGSLNSKGKSLTTRAVFVNVSYSAYLKIQRQHNFI